MAHSWHHVERSARLLRDVAEDDLAIHDWLDESKAFPPDLRQRTLRHHSEGIFLCVPTFGSTFANVAGKTVPMCAIGEQQVKHDLSEISTVASWLLQIEVQPSMRRTAFRPMQTEAIREALADRTTDQAAMSDGHSAAE